MEAYLAATNRIVLVGFSGTGKSTVGRLLAERLGWRLIDIDAEIERETGRSIPSIFASDGEAAFRAIERRHLSAALGEGSVVVATGGGAVADPAVWTEDVLRRPGTLTVWLDAAPETILDRLQRQQAAESSAAERPMLAGADPLGRIVALREQRLSAYGRADLALIVDAVAPTAVMDEIAGLVVGAPPVMLDLPAVQSAIHVRPGLFREAPQLVRERWPRARRVWIVTDERVDALYGAEAERRFAEGGFEARRRAVPAGEGSKSWTTTGTLLDWLLEGGIERGDLIVALGGGVVGDLAGFVAAIALRGVGLVQVPTTLLAMVDSSVGGKTGIDHPTGKNLIGAFYQPPLVLIDPTFLRSLPQRELTAGWAEVVKHAVIQPSTPGGKRTDLLQLLEASGEAARTLREPALTHLIRRNVELKASVVREDERESSLRAILNYGHTLGHGIEAAGYRYLHGEAVAVGMRAAGAIAVRLDLVDEATIARHEALLDAFGLPKHAEVDADRVLAHVLHDKKKAAGKQQWVLATRGGGVTVTTDVPADVARWALEQYLLPRGGALD